MFKVTILNVGIIATIRIFPYPDNITLTAGVA